ncbi:MAG TPA: hypothetical protein VMB18_16795 [Terriglobales bacterium]|nr:hypothetical protein [Terriglobales bacterium]
MERANATSRGFTLIATLLLLLLMSGIAIGMLMMVSTEGKVGTQDVQNNSTFHAAEGAIEKMTSDLANVFQNIQSPTVSEITGLSALAPSNSTAMTYPLYTLTPATDSNGNLLTSYGQIATGPYEGLSAEILPVTLNATAQGPLGDEVNMSRTVEVALIPVFQFGIFSQSDLSFFAGPNLDFQGRVHTNGDLYLAEGTGGTVTFHDQVSAWGNVIRWEMADGNTTAGFNPTHLGNVDILTAASGCDGAQPHCRNMGADTNNATNEGSIANGANPTTWTTSGQNTNWQTISVGDYNSWIITGNYGIAGAANGVPAGGGPTGATQINLPFIGGTGVTQTGPQPYEIIRRPPAGESPTSLLGAARLYNEASIRVMLSDSPEELPHPGYATGASDPNNIRLANFNDANNGVNYSEGVPTSWNATSPGLQALTDGGSYTTYFATASTAVPDPTNWSSLDGANTLPADWMFSPLTPPPVTTLYDPNAPIMNSTANGETVAPPWLNLSVCSSTVAVTVPPGVAPTCPAGTQPNYPWYTPTLAANTTTWNLLDGYLRVEYQDNSGNFHPVTAEWLGLGFARYLTPPITPGSNPVNPNAILLFQEPADRNDDGSLDQVGAAPYTTKSPSGCTNTNRHPCTYTPHPGKPPEDTTDTSTGVIYYGDSKAATQSPTQNNWYPINFYDAREGEVRDIVQAAGSCSPQGLMNAVELDVGNLTRWLNGTTGSNGTNVNYKTQNGYVLYFSDRRGMLPNPNGTWVDPANTLTGDSGFEDAINTPNQNGAPNGILEPIPAGKTESPEDVNNNGVLDNFGAQNLGLGLGYIPWNQTNPPAGGSAYTPADQVTNLVNAAGNPPDPYLIGNRIATCTVMGKQWVSGARHVLKLVDGSLGNLPVRPDNNQGGFTVGSENPVYVYGNYNTSAADPTWGNPNAAEPAHSAAAVIADAVTFLSNDWSDLVSLQNPSNAGGRPANVQTYYRMAVASGKNINFPVNVCCNAWAIGDWGTDGGLHNFLRQLQSWGTTMNYKGSMVSMYYSTYATGVDKNGGGTVYSPPTRNYIFDPLFVHPQDLPPGTPLFRDIDNLSYRQSFTPCTVNAGTGVCSN